MDSYTHIQDYAFAHMLYLSSSMVSCVMQFLRWTSAKGLIRMWNIFYISFHQVLSIIPATLRLPRVRIENDPRICGGYANIYRGRFEGRRVAIKVPRMYKSTSKTERRNMMKNFLSEILIMDVLHQHPHIVQLLGVTSFHGFSCPIMPWMKNGTIVDYILHNQIDRSRRRILVRQIIDALVFMKKANIIHGDLKGTNILIDEDGNARIADFGLSLLGDCHCPIPFPPGQWNILPPQGTHTNAGSLRWMAPELLYAGEDDTAGVKRTFQSDVFALGMVIYEVFSGKVPFQEYKSDWTAMLRIMVGKRPVRPDDIPDDMWQLVQQCWNTNPAFRPSIESIAAKLDQRTDA